MRTIEEVFDLRRAKSAPLGRYEPGLIPYLANSFNNNAVAAYVKPQPGDRVFQKRAIVVSAFGEATVQIPPFIAYGAAGTGLTILEAKHDMSLGQLAYLAAWINITIRWRFNWYHRSTLLRLRSIPLPNDIPRDVNFDVGTLLPAIGIPPKQETPVAWAPFMIKELFYVQRAKSGLLSDYEPGPVAYIRNGLVDNGVDGYVTPRATDKVFQRAAVVVSALCEATVHSPPFIACSRAGNGLIVLEPKSAMPFGMLYCAAAYINKSVRWRFNWYRQVTADRFKNLSISLPAHLSAPDESSAIEMASTLPYWEWISV